MKIKSSLNFCNNGYCYFINTNWEFDNCDSVHDPNRQNEWGGEYGPYQFEHLLREEMKIQQQYILPSTWNPYTVILMKAQLQK